MSTSPVDARMAMDAAGQQDLINRKMSIDALRQRLGDTTTKEQKLRESCEGFEAVFLQKMWEEMRKNVNKEGYLHSKDEEAYQSMFDVELSKKMTSAGGIGLADMLYEQLSQQLSDTGRTASPKARNPLPTGASVSSVKENAAAGAIIPTGPLKVEDLYSELEEVTLVEPLDANEPGLAQALQEIRAELAGVNLGTSGDTAINTLVVDTNGLPKGIPPIIPAAVESAGGKDTGTGFTSWQTKNTLVSSKPKPVSRNRSKNIGKKPETTEPLIAGKFTTKTPKSNMLLPSDAQWPLEGKISNGFGWEQDASGKRHWNGGVSIEAALGSPIVSSMQGTVLFSGAAEGYEHLIVIDHGNDYKSYYGNIADPTVQAGDVVESGTPFATLSANGKEHSQTEKYSTLFFALKRGEMALNPEVVIPRMVTASRE